MEPILASREELRAALADLPDGQREVLEARYGFCGPDRSLEDIGQQLGITKQAVQYREKAAIRKLRRLLGGTRRVDQTNPQSIKNKD
jgi:RNA polymerase primary sigma factor